MIPTGDGGDLARNDRDRTLQGGPSVVPKTAEGADEHHFGLCGSHPFGEGLSKNKDRP